VGGRAQPERVGANRNVIMNKCCIAAVRVKGGQKEVLVGHNGVRNGCIGEQSEIYTPVPRARGAY
jgi:hypothetical protein